MKHLLVEYIPKIPCFFNEVSLDEFFISREQFNELKRTANYKSEITFGYSTFFVGKLVIVLNEVLTKYYDEKFVTLQAEMNPKEEKKEDKK